MIMMQVHNQKSKSEILTCLPPSRSFDLVNNLQVTDVLPVLPLSTDAWLRTKHNKQSRFRQWSKRSRATLPKLVKFCFLQACCPSSDDPPAIACVSLWNVSHIQEGSLLVLRIDSRPKLLKAMMAQYICSIFLPIQPLRGVCWLQSPLAQSYLKHSTVHCTENKINLTGMQYMGYHVIKKIAACMLYGDKKENNANIQNILSQTRWYTH